MNVHLLDGLFLEAHEMKKDKEMYLDVVVGEMQDEGINIVVTEMQDDCFFLKRWTPCVIYYYFFGFSFQINLLNFVGI